MSQQRQDQRSDARTASEDLNQLMQDLANRRHPKMAADEMRALASEAITRGLRHPPADGALRPWVFRIFDNLVADRLRRCDIEKRHSMAWSMHTYAAQQPVDPERALLQAEEAGRLHEAVQGLNADRREPLSMRYCDEEDCAHIAQKLGVAPATVRTRIHRALQSLRTKLKDMRGVVPFGYAAKAVPAALTLAMVSAPLMISRPATTLAQNQTLPTRVAPNIPTADIEPVGIPEVVERLPAVSDKRNRRSAPAIKDEPPAPTRFDFEEDFITGDGELPMGEYFLVPPASSHPSLIEIPSSMVPSLVKSLEDI